MKEDYECFMCPRKQRRSISEEIAQKFGWVKVVGEDKWLCPFCGGNTDKLKELFSKPPSPLS